MKDKLILNLLKEAQGEVNTEEWLKKNNELNKKLERQRTEWMREFYDDLTDLECHYVNEAFELGFDLSLIIHGKEAYFNSNK